MAQNKKILYSNNAKSTLASGITDVATTCTMQAGDGTKFQNPSAGECFIMTFRDAAGNTEIVQVDARSVDSLSSITRGIDGTTPRAWAAGDKMECRPTAGIQAQMVDQSGRNTFAVAGGTGDALTATFVPPYTALVNGTEVRVRAGAANTTSATFAPDGLTAHTIYRHDRQVLVANDIVVNQDMTLRYDSTLTGWVMTTPTPLLVADQVAYAIHSSTGKTTPVDADEMGIVDSAASNVFKKLTWSNIKATLKTYFDALYAPAGIASGSVVGLHAWGGLDLPQNATRYLFGWGKTANNTEANAIIYPAQPITAYELRVHLSAAVPAANSLIVTVRKNGAPTSITCTISAGQTDGSDLVNTADFGTGSYITIEVVTSATFGTTNDVTVTLRAKQFGTSIDCGFGIPASAIGSTPGANAYSAGYPNAEAQVTESLVEVPLSKCILAHLRDHSFSATQGNVTVRRSATTVMTAPQNDVSYLNDNDLYNCRYTATDTLLMNASVACYKPSAGIPGPYSPLLFTTLAQPQNTTRYMLSYCDNQAGGTATETDVLLPMPACTLSTLRAAASAAPPGGQTITFTVRKGSTPGSMADTSMTCQITSSGRTASTTSNPVTFAAGDFMSIKSVSSATAGTLSVNCSAEFSP